MDKKTTVIVATVAVLAVGAAVVVINPDLRRKIFGSSDEDSIRVRGGSMHIDTYDGVWTPDGNDWRNETPAKKVHQNDLWLAVTYNNGAAKCKAAAPGHPIIIRYSDAGVQAHFNPAGNPVRTKVTLTGSWARESNRKTLSHGTPGQGNIADIRVNGADPGCDLTPAALDRIFICSSSADANCR
jgi:hypothetical protein